MPMCDALAESGWEVNRVNFGSTAYDTDAYTNRAAEMWYTMAKKIEAAEVILPEDEDLTAQLTCRRTPSKSKIVHYCLLQQRGITKDLAQGR